MRVVAACIAGLAIASLTSCSHSGSATDPASAFNCDAECLTDSPTATSPAVPGSVLPASSATSSTSRSAVAAPPATSATSAPKSGSTHVVDPPPPTSTGTPIAQAIYIWYVSGSVKQDAAAISDDTKAIAAATGNNNQKALVAGCRSLQHDVAAFQADPPAPDPEARTDFSRAMSFYASGASSCLHGDYPVAGSDLVTGTQWAYQARTRIAKLTGD